MEEERLKHFGFPTILSKPYNYANSSTSSVSDISMPSALRSLELKSAEFRSSMEFGEETLLAPTKEEDVYNDFSMSEPNLFGAKRAGRQQQLRRHRPNRSSRRVIRSDKNNATMLKDVSKALSLNSLRLSSGNDNNNISRRGVVRSDKNNVNMLKNVSRALSLNGILPSNNGNEPKLPGRRGQSENDIFDNNDESPNIPSRRESINSAKLMSMIVANQQHKNITHADDPEEEKDHTRPVIPGKNKSEASTLTTTPENTSQAVPTSENATADDATTPVESKVPGKKQKRFSFLSGEVAGKWNGVRNNNNNNGSGGECEDRNGSTPKSLRRSVLGRGSEALMKMLTSAQLKEFEDGDDDAEGDENDNANETKGASSSSPTKKKRFSLVWKRNSRLLTTDLQELSSQQSSSVLEEECSQSTTTANDNQKAGTSEPAATSKEASSSQFPVFKKNIPSIDRKPNAPWRRISVSRNTFTH